MKKKKDFFIDYDYPNQESTTPTCEHFGECGGCRFQHILYQKQIDMKKEYLKKLFNQDIEIVSSLQELGYRNRMDFVYTQGKLGLRKRGDFKTVIVVNTCHLLPKELHPIFSEIKNLLKENNIEEYDLIKQEGFLRYVVFRYAPTTKQLMLIFTTTSKPNQEDEFRKLLDLLSTKVQSIYWLVFDDITDLSIPPVKPKVVLGTSYITETLLDKDFLVGPHSFFQANSLMSQLVFKDIKEEVSGNTVDLCCGVGTIALCVAENATSLVGLEQIPEAIDLANKNKENNGVTNVQFFCDDMKNILDYIPLEVDTLIVDPPRAGLGKKVVRRIKTMQPKKIIYMSCNPKTQKMDMDDLKDSYELHSIKGYDMFAQTPHIETLAILSKKNSI